MLIIQECGVIVTDGAGTGGIASAVFCFVDTKGETVYRDGLVFWVDTRKCGGEFSLGCMRISSELPHRSMVFEWGLRQME